jgi:Uma2 family endonuclease
MSSTPQVKIEGTPNHPTDPRPRTWTREEYYRLAEEGLFLGEKVELIGGEIVTLNPQRFVHAACVDQISDLLRGLFDDRYWVRMQLPLQCAGTSEPEPDVSVVPGSRRDYSDHPTSAVLVVEVSHTTLEYDRTQKASLYAATGIPEYWIVNLSERVLERMTQPGKDAAQPFGHRYADVRRLAPEETTAPLECPDHLITVAELFP